MEQNVDTGAPIAPVAENNKQNGGDGLKIATAIACIVAVCGIGFGVYGMMQSSQKENQISDLKVQIENLNGKIISLETETSNNESESTPESSKNAVATRVCSGVYSGDAAIGQNAQTGEYINGVLSISLNIDGTYELSKEGMNGEKGTYAIIEDALLLKTAPHICNSDTMDCSAKYSQFLQINEDCSEISWGYGSLFFNPDFVLKK